MSRKRRPDGPPAPLPGVIDAHAHTWSRELQPDHDEVMQRAWATGLAGVIEVGVDTDTSMQCLDLARRDPRVHAVAGLHPHDAQHLEHERAGLEALVAGGGFVGIGETGLDFHYNHSPPEAQIQAFRWQLDLAREHELPVVIHAREADEACFELLEAWSRRVGRYLGAGRAIGMMHCYAGDVALAERYLEIGLLISVPGVVTYPSNARGQQVAAKIRLAGLLVETDCPYLTPVPYRRARNEPAYVAETARFVAALRGVDPEVVVRATAENTARLFDFPGPTETGAQHDDGHDPRR
ncbi:MAG: YchF/TatD family DNA exonuclease [Dehalococcoidia bacterium]|nr:YchF/TatD family DNA exonuclease [Dehalococcoidia bacterium]